MPVFFAALVLYTVVGAVVFQLLDSAIAEEPFHEAVFFTFSTITTIGYGRVVPRSPAAKIFCLVYVFFGVPLTFFALGKLGKWLSNTYWMLNDAYNGICLLTEYRIITVTGAAVRPKSVESSDRRLPLVVIVVFIAILLLTGALMFCFWIDDLSFINGIYFSFVSITTIGFGDIVPRPIYAWHTIALIFYTVAGIVVMTALVTHLLDGLRSLEKLGDSTLRENKWFKFVANARILRFFKIVAGQAPESDCNTLLQENDLDSLEKGNSKSGKIVIPSVADSCTRPISITLLEIRDSSPKSRQRSQSEAPVPTLRYCPLSTAL